MGVRILILQMKPRKLQEAHLCQGSWIVRQRQNEDQVACLSPLDLPTREGWSWCGMRSNMWASMTPEDAGSHPHPSPTGFERAWWRYLSTKICLIYGYLNIQRYLIPVVLLYSDQSSKGLTHSQHLIFTTRVGDVFVPILQMGTPSYREVL